ncbi:hypothetical protein TDB9533_02427 [Thalassocella blandensis]|nr:hypothetical protein TDB9533_02427 [Thalassocella blandensis]
MNISSAVKSSSHTHGQHKTKSHGHHSSSKTSSSKSSSSSSKTSGHHSSSKTSSHHSSSSSKKTALDPNSRKSSSSSSSSSHASSSHHTSHLAHTLQQAAISKSRSPSPIRKQSLFEAKHWENALVNANAKQKKPSKNILSDINSPNFWKKMPSDKSKPRTVDDICRSVGPEILTDLRFSQSGGELKVYRAMSTNEAANIMNWKANKGTAEQFVASGQADSKSLKQNNLILPVGGHMGDYDQAKHYKDKDPTSQLLEFKLKPGAEKLLFSDKCMAVTRNGKPSAAITMLNILEKGRPFPQASGNEGTKPGFIGFKSESHGDFSLAIGKNQPSALMFQLLVDDVKVVG